MTKKFKIIADASESDYITPGKVYETYGPLDRLFCIENNNGTKIICSPIGKPCAQLGGGNAWRIYEEPKMGLATPSSTEAEAEFFMIHHLGLAAMYFEGTSPGLDKRLPKEDFSAPAIRAWVEAMEELYPDD